MQPANVTLQIVQGATLRESLRVMQSDFEYRPIDAISNTAPVVLTVDHHLPTDWPVWIKGVQNLSDLNRAPNQLPHFATVIDEDTLEINAVTADGRTAAGGMLFYHPPVDLTGASAQLQVLDDKGALLLEIVPVVHAGGWIDFTLSAEATAALTWRKGVWLLNVTLSSGEVRPVFAGPACVAPPGTAPAAACNSPGWVYTFGKQGPSGAGDPSELLALIEAQQAQIDELFDLINGGGVTPASVVSDGNLVVSNGSFVVSSGVH